MSCLRRARISVVSLLVSEISRSEERISASAAVFAATCPEKLALSPVRVAVKAVVCVRISVRVSVNSAVCVRSVFETVVVTPIILSLSVSWKASRMLSSRASKSRAILVNSPATPTCDASYIVAESWLSAGSSSDRRLSDCWDAGGDCSVEGVRSRPPRPP